MDGDLFDGFVRLLAIGSARRSFLRRLAGGVGGALLGSLAVSRSVEDAAAGCRKPGKTCGKGDKCCGGARCRGGRCTCGGGKIACGGTCVNAECCTDDDCELGLTCQSGVCLCPDQNEATCGNTCCVPVVERCCGLGGGRFGCRTIPGQPCTSDDYCCNDNPSFEPTVCRNGRCCWSTGATCTGPSSSLCCSGVCNGGQCA